jgi:hypothetical protein
MVLLVVLLAQMMPPSDGSSLGSSLGNIAELHQAWENLNSACRALPQDSPEGETTCLQRNILGWQLGQLGWCRKNEGLQIKWEMCPRTGR